MNRRPFRVTTMSKGFILSPICRDIETFPAPATRICETFVANLA